MRILFCLLLTAALAWADVPWGDEIVMKSGGHRNLPGKMELRVVSIGADSATLGLGPQTRRIEVGKTLDTGAYRVHLVSAGDGRCTVKWLRCPSASAAIEFIQTYGWKPAGPFQDSTLEIGTDFHGPADTHYQWASQRLGLDLRAASGQKVTVRRYRLQEVTRNANQLYAHVAVYEGRIIGAWLSTDGPVAPGIGSLDQRDALQW